ncbi:MAG TPA: EMC3/TMCO1 family protein [Candidatus Thermoplasmatota archaeon]|nr:EMC3/TMCO1 family protein [Candidatus Thermoplasmatota archaeon]
MADAASSPAPGASGGAAGPPKPKAGSLMTFVAIAAVMFIMFNAELRNNIGRWVGVALDPAFGFGGRWPVLTILLAGTLMVLATTLIRHFTTDWLEQARISAYMRSFNKELMAARKENNTYKMKKLQDRQPEVLKMQQEMSAKQMRTMPLTMIVVVPLFAWLFLFLEKLDYWWYSAPWNPQVDMFGTTVFPHYILLYMALSIPLGALVQKAMKYASWKERWQARHPEVHE